MRGSEPGSFTIYGEYLGTDLTFREVPSTDGPVLEVMADNNEHDVTIRLTPGAVRELRLELQRYERRLA